jgi:uncharacterized cupin superfamily protein
MLKWIFINKGGAMKIEVKRPAREELENQGVFDWPIWEKEVSRFDWHYDREEVCYLLEGRADVITPDGQNVTFGAGDMVRFPAGLSCTWDISATVKKHFLI